MAPQGTTTKLSCKGRAKQCAEAAQKAGSTKAGITCETEPIGQGKTSAAEDSTIPTGGAAMKCLSEDGYELDPSLDVPNDLGFDLENRLLREGATLVKECRRWDDST